MAETKSLLGIMKKTLMVKICKDINIILSDLNRSHSGKKWPRLFEQNSPIYKWNPSGLVWAKRSQC